MARHATLEESLSDINRLGLTNSEKVDPQTPAYQGFHFSALSFLREVPWALYLHLHVCHQVLNLTCFGLDCKTKVPRLLGTPIFQALRRSDERLAYLVLLPNPVSSCLCLQVILGVPITVEYDDSVSCGQVQTEPSRSRRQQETEVLRAFSIEVVQSLLSDITSDGAIQPLMVATKQYLWTSPSKNIPSIALYGINFSSSIVATMLDAQFHFRSSAQDCQATFDIPHWNYWISY